MPGGWACQWGKNGKKPEREKVYSLDTAARRFALREESAGFD
jgi:hypothetical protein